MQSIKKKKKGGGGWGGEEGVTHVQVVVRENRKCSAPQFTVLSDRRHGRVTR